MYIRKWIFFVEYYSTVYCSLLHLFFFFSMNGQINARKHCSDVETHSTVLRNTPVVWMPDCAFLINPVHKMCNLAALLVRLARRCCVCACAVVSVSTISTRNPEHQCGGSPLRVSFERINDNLIHVCVNIVRN